MNTQLFLVFLIAYLLYPQKIISNIKNIEYNIDTIVCIKNDTILADNIILKFRDNGEFYIKDSVSVIVLGNIIAERKQIFLGNGNVILDKSKISNVYPEWWGALPNDTLCDAKAIEKSILSKKNVLFKGNSTYLIKRTINISSTSVSLKSDPDFISATIKVIGDINSFVFSGIPLDTFLIKQDLVKNQNIIINNNKLYANTGDLLILKSNKLWYYDNRNYLFKGETNIILQNNGELLKLSSKLNDNYKQSEETATAYLFRPIKVDINNLKIIGFNNYYCSAIVINYGKNIYINNVYIEHFGYSGLMLTNCYSSFIYNSSFIHISHEKTGYGIQDFGSFGTNVEHCFFRYCRRGVDFSGITPSRNGIVKNCIVEGGGVSNNGYKMISNHGNSGFGTHGTAENIVFINNKILDVKMGFLLRGKNIRIINNILSGKIEMAIYQHTGKDIYISNNCYSFCNSDNAKDDYRYYLLREFLRIGPDVSANNEIEIINNDILELRGDFVYVLGLNNLEKLIVKNNKIVINTNSSKKNVSILKSYKDLKINNLQISDNIISVKNGSFIKYKILN